ncbi:ER membrane protein complex subunit 8/9 [Oratosquilla oratoria]|uniref:ER membrane protein complex subunit 8/9 n=1 Tax=Oratosquilla oratoria TaxID=337810 RepID=UPI003F770051
MSGDITISSAAFTKMVLHAAKYPHAAVNGILLSSSSREGQSRIMFEDAVPLFHQQLGLSPMMEIALTQIEQRYRSDGLVIAGYYQANEHFRDNVPDFIAMKVAEKIAENNNDACLIMIDNKRVCLQLETAPIIVSQLMSDGKWKSREKSSVHLENSECLETTSQLLQRKVQHELHDFDNHLDDLTCDWANLHINKILKSLTDAGLE